MHKTSRETQGAISLHGNRKKAQRRNRDKVETMCFSGVTTMLNFFTTSNGFRSTLPVVSNLTAMNVWDGVCMCFIYASLLEFVCVNYVGRKRPMHNVVYRPGENPVTQVLLLTLLPSYIHDPPALFLFSPTLVRFVFPPLCKRSLFIHIGFAFISFFFSRFTIPKIQSHSQFSHPEFTERNSRHYFLSVWLCLWFFLFYCLFTPHCLYFMFFLLSSSRFLTNRHLFFLIFRSVRATRISRTFTRWLTKWISGEVLTLAIEFSSYSFFFTTNAGVDSPERDEL